jgi:hypothetical protein
MRALHGNPSICPHTWIVMEKTRWINHTNYHSSMHRVVRTGLTVSTIVQAEPFAVRGGG